MKKIEYKAPEMEVVDLKLQGILCTSTQESGGSTPGEWNPNPGEGPGE